MVCRQDRAPTRTRRTAYVRLSFDWFPPSVHHTGLCTPGSLLCGCRVNSLASGADQCPMSNVLFSHDRDLSHVRGARHVCGADEVGHGAWAGPLVVAAVRFDYDQLDANPRAL